ncbi:DgyrCDS2596 [Dimorphilus gyrociliatus]|uniref:DgyrCDS2596 n=1 Tax=Dimorphilus gyrociliatus TaxID=2664684 RepID=A0A7I8VFX7_9ANNE|nr:DgyrCDS2596 [Dimorphilus gyrociliatus]
MGTEKKKVWDKNGIEDVIRDVLDAYLNSMKYDGPRCCKLTGEICLMIKNRIQQTGSVDMNKKLVVQVLIGQESSDVIKFSSRCFWDRHLDHVASATYRNKHLYGFAIVYSCSY